jgi:16S rRNA (uracil1498-N3)-methyltransferase
MSGSIRLYVSEVLTLHAEVRLAATQTHYLATVMRAAVGDTLRLFNGTDGEWTARVIALRRGEVRLRVEGQTRLQSPEPDLWLLFAPLKRDATDLVVQKATELGASALYPVLTARSNTTRVNAERWAAIAVEAAEQCERLTLPAIAAPRPLPAVLAEWPTGRTLVVAMERADVPAMRRAAGPTALLVGPEGGFTGAELDGLRRYPFVTPASLGPRILRAETAAIVGLALLQLSADG